MRLNFNRVARGNSKPVSPFFPRLLNPSKCSHSKIQRICTHIYIYITGIVDQTPLGSPKPVLRNLSKPKDVATLAKHLQGPTQSLDCTAKRQLTVSVLHIRPHSGLLEIKAAALLCRKSNCASSKSNFCRVAPRFEFMVIHGIRRNMEVVPFTHRVEQVRLASLHSNATAMKKTTLAVEVHHLSYAML